jgi:serine protease Do
MAIRRASPAVVNIHGQKTVRNTAASMAGASGADSLRQVNGMGTGVVIDPRGYVITNYHVVEDVEEIRVTLHDGGTTTAELVAARIQNDLALIKVNVDRALPTIPRGTSCDLMVGESVIAIGNAYGYVHTSTEGIISALHRDIPVNEQQHYQDLIQISAGINPGNSGGPLLNIDGEIIGINVAVRVGAQQIAFAIPIDQVVETVTNMIDEYNETRLATGLAIDGGPQDGDGITIASVSANSIADRDGLLPGDRVVRVGSQPVDDRLDFALSLLDVTPGAPLELEVQRSGKSMLIAMRSEAKQPQTRPSGIDLAWQLIGIQVKPVPEASIRRMNTRLHTTYRGALLITAIRPGSAADQQGLQPGDVLLGLHGWQTASVTDLVGILDHPEIKSGPRAKFYIVRRDQTLQGQIQIAAQNGQKVR